MIYQCLGCNHTEARGCLPTVSCGLYFVALTTVVASLLVSLAVIIARRGLIEPLGLWWLVVVAGSVLVGALLSIVLNLVFSLLEWLAYCAKRCPKCRGRKWSRGTTSGFGL